MVLKKFSILITTKDRLRDLRLTLESLKYLISRKDVECIICDDGSSDGTFTFVKEEYPTIILIHNKKSKGLIYSRNRLLNMTVANYAISLDDDALIISNNPLKKIESYFQKHDQCGILAFRIFWGKEELKDLYSSEHPIRVKGFVGCGHVWNMKAWKTIPNYPDWFVFYGEEDFAAFELFKKRWEIHYFPQILIQHRVDVKARKKHKDYQLRLRRSLRAGWYLYLLFYPWQLIPKKIIYTLWMQLKLKVFKGDMKALVAIIQAFLDVIINLGRLFMNSNRLTISEFEDFSKISDTKLYWEPENN